MLRARTLQLRAGIRRRGRAIHQPARAEDSSQLPEDLLEQAHNAVLARISEFGQGAALIRRSRE
jgi:hypothetical protein